MKFFDRQNEIAKLREIRARSSESATLTVMTGRRRVGKTELVKAAFSDRPFNSLGHCARQDVPLRNHE